MRKSRLDTRRHFCLFHVAIVLSVFCTSSCRESQTDLTVVAVLRGWKWEYERFLGRPANAVISEYGEPDRRPHVDSGEILQYHFKSNPERRALVIQVGEDGLVRLVKVFAKPDEHLDVREVIRRVADFTYSSGVQEDGITHYFQARTKTENSELQWTIKEGKIEFDAAIFERE